MTEANMAVCGGTYLLFKVSGYSSVVIEQSVVGISGGVDEQKKVVVDFIRKNLLSIL